MINLQISEGDALQLAEESVDVKNLLQNFHPEIFIKKINHETYYNSSKLRKAARQLGNATSDFMKVRRSGIFKYQGFVISHSSHHHGMKWKIVNDNDGCQVLVPLNETTDQDQTMISLKISKEEVLKLAEESDDIRKLLGEKLLGEKCPRMLPKTINPQTIYCNKGVREAARQLGNTTSDFMKVRSSGNLKHRGFMLSYNSHNHGMKWKIVNDNDGFQVLVPLNETTDQN